MKKIILLCFLITTTSYLNSVLAQTIDSISIELRKERQFDYGPWDYLSMKSDSFSTGLLKSSLQRKRSSNSWVNYKFDSFYSDSTLSQSWNTTWLNDILTIAYHNSIGLDSLVLTQQWKNSMWVNLKKQENFFAVDSTFLSQTFSFWDTLLSQWNFTVRHLWLKDSLGNDTGYISQNYISGSWENYNGIFSHYTGGLVTVQYDYNWNDFDSSFSDINSISTFTYDSFGRHIYDYIDGIPGGFLKNTYTYDSTGILINLLSHSESQGGYIHEWNTQWICYSYPNSSSIYLFAYNDTISICGNDSVPAGFFAIGGTAPLHFQWIPLSAVDNDTIENPYFIGDTSSLLAITVTDAAAHSLTDNIFLKVNEPPSILSVKAIAACIGCSNGMFVMNVTNGSAPLYYYSVTPSGVHIPLTDKIRNLAQGIYTICLYDYNHCSVCVVDTILEENILVSETNNELIKISPNPTNGNITISLPKQSPFTDVTITNAFGQEVSRARYSNTSMLELDIKGTSGLYFVRVVAGDRSWIYKVVKM